MKINFKAAINDADDFVYRPGCKNENRGKFTVFRVDRDTVPEGWYAYDVRENGDTGNLCSINLNETLVNHAGTFLTQHRIGFPEGQNFVMMRGRGGYTFI